MKKLLSIFLSLILCLSVGVTALACNPTEADAKPNAMVTVDINPSIELTVDEKGVVLSVYGANQDGQVLLYDETDLEGLTVERAVEKITELAKRYGYLTQENSTVTTSVTGVNSELEEKLLNKINAKITAKSEEFGFEINVDGNSIYSVIRKYEEFKTDYPNINISIKDFRLALSASQTGEITLETAVTLPKAELLEIISSAHDDFEGHFNAEIERQVAERKKEYEERLNDQISKLYLDHYLAKIAKNPFSVIHGIEYFGYNTIANALDNVGDIVTLIRQNKNAELSEEQIGLVMTALGIEDRGLITNSEGVITVESVESYANKLFKTLTEQAKQELKEKLSPVLNQIDADIKGKIQAQIDEYVKEIKAVIQTITDSIPEQVMNLFDREYGQLVSTLNDILSDGVITEYELEQLKDKFEEKAERALEKINRDLTDKEKQEINQKKVQIKEDLKHLKEQAENAEEQAEQNAKAHFENLKNHLHGRQPK